MTRFRFDRERRSELGRRLAPERRQVEVVGSFDRRVEDRCGADPGGRIGPGLSVDETYDTGRYGFDDTVAIE